MLLRCSDGVLKVELTTGCVLTHGEPAGVLVDSSKSNKETVALIKQSMAAQLRLAPQENLQRLNSEV